MVLMKKIQSTCNLCALACNLDFYVEDGKIEKVAPTVDYPVNQGFCCIKASIAGIQQRPPVFAEPVIDRGFHRGRMMGRIHWQNFVPAGRERFPCFHGMQQQRPILQRTNAVRRWKRNGIKIRFSQYGCVGRFGQIQVHGHIWAGS